MNKEKNIQRAKEIFAAYSKDTLHFTSDGQSFFLKNDADNHAKSLADKTLHIVERSDVMPGKADTGSAGFDEDDEAGFGEEREAKEGKPAKAAPKAKPKKDDIKEPATDKQPAADEKQEGDKGSADGEGEGSGEGEQA